MNVGILVGTKKKFKFVSEQTISDNFIPILYQHHFLLFV
jgi:hypothetical protein